MRVDRLAPGRPDPPTAWEAAEAEGYDMSMLEGNLRKTPLERIRAHDRALIAALALRKAMEQAHARTRIPA